YCRCIDPESSRMSSRFGLTLVAGCASGPSEMSVSCACAAGTAAMAAHARVHAAMRFAFLIRPPSGLLLEDRRLYVAQGVARPGDLHGDAVERVGRRADGVGAV